MSGDRRDVDHARDGCPDVTVLICTFNRAPYLAETLESLRRSRVSSGFLWDVIVVDNNSTDHTRQVVEERVPAYPVPLRYCFEPRQGKSNALNTGLEMVTAPVIAFTDDDVRVSPVWLEAGCAPLLAGGTIAYTGGPVRPIWGAEPPDWLSRTSGELWGTLAITDYGGEPFVFEERRKIPIGANMAVARALIARIGGFRPELGRNGNRLMGQEQAEFFCRSRAAGARGLYVPEMAVEHHVPAARLTRQYFRRWWFGKGVSRALVDKIHPTTELGLDLTRVPRIAGIPRYMYGAALRHARAWLMSTGPSGRVRRARSEMMLCFYTGYLTARRRAVLVREFGCAGASVLNSGSPTSADITACRNISPP